MSIGIANINQYFDLGYRLIGSFNEEFVELPNIIRSKPRGISVAIRALCGRVNVLSSQLTVCPKCLIDLGSTLLLSCDLEAQGASDYELGALAKVCFRKDEPGAKKMCIKLKEALLDHKYYDGDAELIKSLVEVKPETGIGNFCWRVGTHWV